MPDPVVRFENEECAALSNGRVEEEREGKGNEYCKK
jgi:hypothetical protein